MSAIIAAIDEIEDNLYYFSDVVSAGIPDVGRLITDGIMMILTFPLLLPSLRVMPNNVWTSLYGLVIFFNLVLSLFKGLQKFRRDFDSYYATYLYHCLICIIIGHATRCCPFSILTLLHPEDCQNQRFGKHHCCCSLLSLKGLYK